MTPLSAVALLSAGVILVAGCAHSRAAPPPAAPAPAVTSEDIQRSPAQSVERLLASLVAGVIVTQTPDGGMAVRIRGSASVYGNNDPLYVIDGIPVQAGPGGTLPGISPYDIERIDVLKDPASMTMYGIRGANGIIVVKTKRAAQ